MRQREVALTVGKRQRKIILTDGVRQRGSNSDIQSKTKGSKSDRSEWFNKEVEMNLEKTEAYLICDFENEIMSMVYVHTLNKATFSTHTIHMANRFIIIVYITKRMIKQKAKVQPYTSHNI